MPLEDLLVTQRLSREIAQYKDPSPAARAAAQLEAIGQHVRPGQKVRFLLLRGDRGGARLESARLARAAAAGFCPLPRADHPRGQQHLRAAGDQRGVIE